MANISIDVADNEARQDLQDLQDYVDSAAFDKQSLSVSQNGTYTAPAGKAYSPVTVNVASGGDNVFLITVTRSGDSPSMDKTYQEIHDAYMNGDTLLVCYDASDNNEINKYYLRLIQYRSDPEDYTSWSQFIFMYVYPWENGQGVITIDRIYASIEIEYETPAIYLDVNVN